MKQSLLKGTWVETLAATLAFASLLCVILLPSKPRLWQDALGDFKLVYASASGLLHNGDAYSYGELSRVFHQSNVDQPADWYGRNPVYPYFTLFTISPLLIFSMLPAAYVWGCMDYLVMGLTALRLVKHAERRYGLGLGWRLAIIAFMAASPLVSFGLEVANLSVLTACLCIFVVTAERDENVWLLAGALAFALLLKPHLAFWVVLALLIARREPDRRVAWRGFALFAAVVLAMTAYLAWFHQFFPLMASYADMLHREAAGGSMDFRNHQDFLVPAQITALGMLLGYWIASLHQIALLQMIILPPLGIALLWASLRKPSAEKPLLVSAWVTFGFLVTYHRAHDGIVLFLLLPWAMSRLKQCWHDGPAVVVLACYALFSIDVPRDWWKSLATVAPFRPLADLLYDRQVATATLLLCLSLTVLLLRGIRLPHAPISLEAQSTNLGQLERSRNLTVR